MKYKDKILRKRLLAQSLCVLTDFACTEPKLSLEKRRAIVASIRFGGCLFKPNKDAKPQTISGINYQLTRQGLLRSCLDKLVSCPDTENEVKKAICTISSLNAWAYVNPNLTQDVFAAFVSRIIPEDENHLRKANLRSDKFLDWVARYPNSFYKKYPQR